MELEDWDRQQEGVEGDEEGIRVTVHDGETGHLHCLVHVPPAYVFLQVGLPRLGPFKGSTRAEVADAFVQSACRTLGLEDTSERPRFLLRWGGKASQEPHIC